MYIYIDIFALEPNHKYSSPLNNNTLIFLGHESLTDFMSLFFILFHFKTFQVVS
jgi:hypothetical protein